MTENQWEAFCTFREQYKNLCESWSVFGQEIIALEKEVIREKEDTPPYSMELPVVYNKAYDEVTKDHDIHMIVIGDNPGKDEQLKVNSKYLVGQSGKIAEGFFRKHAELETDFRKNVIILNKTPLHTAKTNHLNYLKKKGSPDIKNLISESQKKVASLTADLHKSLVENSEKGTFVPELWIVGYAELKDKKIFVEYRDTLRDCYKGHEEAWNKVFVYQHFSMNRFSIDLKNYMSAHEGMGLKESLVELGKIHKSEIFA